MFSSSSDTDQAKRSPSITNDGLFMCDELYTNITPVTPLIYNTLSVISTSIISESFCIVSCSVNL